MTRFGYTLMTEQSGPRELVGYAGGAERAGFDFLVSSDHSSVAGFHGPRTVRLVGARRSHPGDRAGGVAHLRHLSDDAIPPGRRGALLDKLRAAAPSN